MDRNSSRGTGGGRGYSQEAHLLSGIRPGGVGEGFLQQGPVLELVLEHSLNAAAVAVYQLLGGPPHLHHPHVGNQLQRKRTSMYHQMVADLTTCLCKYQCSSMSVQCTTVHVKLMLSWSSITRTHGCTRKLGLLPMFEVPADCLMPSQACCHTTSDS